MLPTTQGRVTGLNLSENKTDESLFIPIIITLTFFFSFVLLGVGLYCEQDALRDAFPDMLVVHEL